MFNQKPDMKAKEITAAGIEALKSGKYKMVSGRVGSSKEGGALDCDKYKVVSSRVGRAGLQGGPTDFSKCKMVSGRVGRARGWGGLNFMGLTMQASVATLLPSTFEVHISSCRCV